MYYCMQCGKASEDGSGCCSHCGAPAEKISVNPVACDVELDETESAFLENTYRLLCWERKAWNIHSKYYIVVGIIYAVIAMLIDSWPGFIFCGAFFVFGIVSHKAARKLSLYIHTVYTDISLAYNRCENVGMLIFNILCGAVSPIFFIINFVRMKSNRTVIESIMCKQKV